MSHKKSKPIENGTLYVVDNLKDEFKTTSPWNRFGKIVGFEESTGISAITTGTDNAWVFDMQGYRLDNVQKGVNIIHTKEGKTKKVLMTDGLYRQGEKTLAFSWKLQINSDLYG